MKWFLRIDRAVTVLMFLARWFRGASRDGRLTIPEVAEGVSQLVHLAGFDGQIKVDPYQPTEKTDDEKA